MGDELAFGTPAFELRRSTSPAFMEDYRKKDLPVSQVPISGQEPVQAISYRPIAHTSLDQISGLVPTYATNMTTAMTGGLPTTVTTTTSTGYVNGGQSINFRPMLTEPVDRSSGLGVGEIDFDTKCTDAYANLDDIRDRDYHQTTEAIYKGVPNRSKEQKQKAKVSCCFASFVIFIFIFQVVILVLAVFNLANGLEVGSLTKRLIAPTSTQTISEVSLSVMVTQLQEEVAQLKRNLDEFNSIHSSNFSTFYTKLHSINETVANLFTSVPSPTPPVSNVSVPLDQDCVTNRKECTTAFSTPSSSTNPSFTSCITPEYKHNETDHSVYLADLFCSVDTDNQLMPIATTLSLTDRGYSCLCHGIEIPSSIQPTLQNFRCFLFFTVCPTSIPVTVSLR